MVYFSETYQPGNMTRYDMYAMRVNGQSMSGEDVWLFTTFIGTRGYSMRVHSYETEVHAGYVQEKMSLRNEGDAEAITNWINTVLNRFGSR